MQAYALRKASNRLKRRLTSLKSEALEVLYWCCRDLWLTMRSAYSARLPKGELKLIYQDVDDDMMQYQDEPWEHFKAMARRIYLSRN